MLKPLAPVVVPTVVREPTVDEPNVPAFEKRFVDDAVVLKNVVLVEFPSVVLWLSKYAADVVLNPKPTLLQ